MKILRHDNRSSNSVRRGYVSSGSEARYSCSKPARSNQRVATDVGVNEWMMERAAEVLPSLD
jgi:hypothetical protein